MSDPSGDDGGSRKRSRTRRTRSKSPIHLEEPDLRSDVRRGSRRGDSLRDHVRRLHAAHRNIEQPAGRVRTLAGLGTHRGSAEVLCAAWCTQKAPVVWWQTVPDVVTARQRESTFDRRERVGTGAGARGTAKNQEDPQRADRPAQSRVPGAHPPGIPCALGAIHVMGSWVDLSERYSNQLDGLENPSTGVD